MSFPFDDFPRQTVALIFAWGVRASVLASFFRSPPAVSPRVLHFSALTQSKLRSGEGGRKKRERGTKKRKQKPLPMIGAKAVARQIPERWNVCRTYGAKLYRFCTPDSISSPYVFPLRKTAAFFPPFSSFFSCRSTRRPECCQIFESFEFHRLSHKVR